jgi:hypothetical protein
MLFLLTAAHHLRLADGENSAVIEAGEMIGHGKLPDDWVTQRREEHKPAKIAAPYRAPPTPSMEPQDDEARVEMDDYLAAHPGVQIGAVESLPVCGGSWS